MSACFSNMIQLLLLLKGAASYRVTAARDPNLTYETFLSPAISLKSGQIANTAADWPGDGKFLDFIKGPAAIRHFQASIVSDNDREVGLEEVYVHHWLMYENLTSTGGTINAGYCSNLGNVWGIGAEIRGVVYNYPAPYAIMVTGHETWTVNMHLIRTTNVPDQDLQDCIECNCANSAPPLNPLGGVACCPDGGQCWGMHNSTLNDAKNYYLKYTIGYAPVTPDVVPLNVITLDVTASQTSDCHIEYQVPALGPGEQHVLTGYSEIPENMTVVFLEAHQHIGGMETLVEQYRDGSLVQTLCDASPRYGNGTQIGNENGYVVDIPTCSPSQPFQILAGDQIKITSTYTSKTLPAPAVGHSWHEGVMGLVFMAAHVTPTQQQTCTSGFQRFCRAPPYKTSKQCLECFAEVSARGLLKPFHCENQWVKQLCSQNFNGGHIPVPSALRNVTAKYVAGAQNLTNITLTGPADAWLGMGFNAVNQYMNGSFAWVYVDDGSGSGSKALQMRRLGNHNPGVLLNPNYPASITTAGGLTTIQFSTINPGIKLALSALSVLSEESAQAAPADLLPPLHFSAHNCFLFAQGDPSASDPFALFYHGANRGTACIPGKEGGRQLG